MAKNIAITAGSQQSYMRNISDHQFFKDHQMNMNQPTKSTFMHKRPKKGGEKTPKKQQQNRKSSQDAPQMIFPLPSQSPLNFLQKFEQAIDLSSTQKFGKTGQNFFNSNDQRCRSLTGVQEMIRNGTIVKVQSRNTANSTQIVKSSKENSSPPSRVLDHLRNSKQNDSPVKL